MCLIPYIGSEFKIADRDIVCYKIVEKRANGIYKSPYVGFEYVIRVTYKDSVRCDYTERYEITKGMFHSFASGRDACRLCEEWNGTCDKIKHKVLKCIIPKGSTYIAGFFSRFMPSYASKQIKILEEICFQ